MINTFKSRQKHYSKVIRGFYGLKLSADITNGGWNLLATEILTLSVFWCGCGLVFLKKLKVALTE